MSRYFLAAALSLLAAVMLAASAATTVNSSATPTLFSVRAGTSQTLAGGAQKTIPVTIDEDKAFSAIFAGGMWLPDASGGRVFAKYDHHIIHDNGDWTFVGKVLTAHGQQSAVITFGRDAVFGLIPQPSGYPLRLTTSHGHTLLLHTDGAALARSPVFAALHAKQDYKIPSRHRAGATSQPAATQTQGSAQSQTSGGPVIDVMVAYTPGFVSEYGTVSAALTRINNLVDLANQAYSDSQVHQSIRLVHTVQVTYPDNNSNTTALDDITGSDGTNPHTIPASLRGIAALRTQYGADLVSMLRKFDNATDGGCGLGWLIGGGETQIVPSQDNGFGYSVVSDGSDAGYFCLDSSFAHELGHNMGDAHDRANSDGPGAYSYSYGFKSVGSSGFATIMAYGGASQDPLDVFSNPNISICESQPCGVADSSSNSADNVHSMNNTAALIAQFEATEVGIAPAGYVPRHDVNGDGTSDLLLYNPAPARLGWWLLNGTTVLSYQSQGVSSGWNVVATGDFNGDGKTDVVWTDSANNVYLWLSTGTGFTSHFVAKNATGWRVVGAADVNGDADADLLVYNPSPARLGWWLMNGSTVLSYHAQGVSSGWNYSATGDFDGNGKADVVWVDAANNVYLWLGNGSNFSSRFVARNGAGWSVVGAGDVDGDGRSDLLVYNPSPARLGWWLMNGANVLSYHSQVTTAGFRTVSTGDFNGDGRTDVAWLSSGTSLNLWIGSGTSFNSQQVGNYTPGWQVVY